MNLCRRMTNGGWYRDQTHCFAAQSRYVRDVMMKEMQSTLLTTVKEQKAFADWSGYKPALLA